jgi:hypothetical protein
MDAGKVNTEDNLVKDRGNGGEHLGVVLVKCNEYLSKNKSELCETLKNSREEKCTVCKY